MSKRNILFFVLDMLEAIAKIERYTAGLTGEHFAANEMVLDAVVRNLEIIGEAARHLPGELRERYADIDWRRIVGFRNIVIHEYFDVDPAIVWAIATQHLPRLKRVLEQMRVDMETR